MRLNNSYRTQSFKLILFTTFMFMVGYITQRISLTVYLNHSGYNLNESYSISTSYVALFSICSLAWGYISKHLPRQEKIVMLAILSISIGLSLITLPYKNIQMTGISFVIIGGSLYFTFMSLLVNQHFTTAGERQQGNHLYQIMFNIGALIGVIAIGLMPISKYYLVYRMGSLITLIGFILLIKSNISMSESDILEKKVSINQRINFIVAFIATFIFVYTLLRFGDLTRIISIVTFMIGCTYIVCRAIIEKNKNYITFLIMLIICGFPYWFAVAIVYSQFTIFLTQQVNSTLFGVTIPPMAVLSLDAVANVFFGYTIYRVYKRYQIQPNTLLLYSLLLTAFAFLFLVAPLYLSNTNEKISLIWPILAISSYAVAEFLLVTTLTSQINSLVNDKNRQGIFISMEYLASAVCASGAYYLMHLKNGNVDVAQIMNQDMHLYLVIMVFTLIASFIFFILNKLKFIEAHIS